MPPRVVVIGAGIMGASSAFHLAARGATVTVLEQFESAAEGSTGRSFASVRSQWSDSLNIELSWRSIQTYRDFPQLHGVDVGYRATGYLYLWPDGLLEGQLANVALQRAHGVYVDVLEPSQAQSLTPFVADGIAGCTWGPTDGVVDPYLATNAYLGLARDHGAIVRFGATVTAIERTPSGWRVVTSESSVECDVVVNCAGGWSGQTAALAGLEVPVDHLRRCIYSTAAGATPTHPMTIDVATGVYLRSEGERLLFGLSRPDEEHGYNTAIDWPWMETVLERAEARFPWLLDAPLDPSGAWAGTYEITPDSFPVLGRLPEAQDWVNACGFSGHGVMQGPMAGLLVAEEVIDGRAHTVDIDPLRIDRLRGGAMRTDKMVL